MQFQFLYSFLKYAHQRPHIMNCALWQYTFNRSSTCWTVVLCGADQKNNRSNGIYSARFTNFRMSYGSINPFGDFVRPDVTRHYPGCRSGTGSSICAKTRTACWSNCIVNTRHSEEDQKPLTLTLSQRERGLKAKADLYNTTNQLPLPRERAGGKYSAQQKARHRSLGGGLFSAA